MTRPSPMRFNQEGVYNLKSKLIVILGAIITGILIALLPLQEWLHITPEGHKLISVIAIVIVLWVTEAVDVAVTALLAAVLVIFLGIAKPDVVFGSYANSIIFLFIGSFILAKAISVYELDKLFAMRILGLRVVSTPKRVLLAVGLISTIISMWISNTAATAIMLPIVTGIIAGMLSEAKKQNKEAEFLKSGFPAGLLLITAFGASIGGIATPVGSPPNLIGIGFLSNLAGIKINFLQWIMFALPITMLMFVILYLLMSFMFRTDIEIPVSPVLQDKIILNRGQKNIILAFGITVALWLLPGMIGLIYGTGTELYKWIDKLLDSGAVAILGAIFLFVLPADGDKPTLTWEQAVEIDWGVILLFGSGMMLGKMITETKLSALIGQAVGANNANFWVFVAVIVLLGILFSETMSNTTAASIMAPIVISIAVANHIDPVIPTLAVVLACSFGFMLPVSTPPNAIVYSTRQIPISTMIKTGIWFDILGGISIVIGLMILSPLIGLLIIR